MSLLDLAEQRDNYIKSCKNNYVNNLVRINFSYSIEKNSYIEEHIKEYIKQYPIFNSINIIILNETAENGYPHTRPNDIICIPSNLRFPSLEKTLFHEVVHIHQRKYPKLWEEFLNREKWFLETPETIPIRWKEKCRLNPDTILKPFWSYNKRYIPLPLFIKDSNVKFEEIRVMYYDLESGVLEHNAPECIKEKYGNNSQPEHPYELYAVILAEKYPLTEEKISKFLLDGYV